MESLESVVKVYCRFLFFFTLLNVDYTSCNIKLTSDVKVTKQSTVKITMINIHNFYLHFPQIIITGQIMESCYSRTNCYKVAKLPGQVFLS